MCVKLETHESFLVAQLLNDVRCRVSVSTPYNYFSIKIIKSEKKVTNK